MTSERFQRVRQIFLAARERAPADRAAFVARECAGDEALSHEVLRLLDAEHADPRFLATPALGPRVNLHDVASDAGGADDDDEANDPLVGTHIGKYVVLSRLAAGGMGRIYRGQQEHPHRFVAIKVVSRGHETRAAVNRFILESEILASLSHPGVAQVYEAGCFRQAGRETPYFAMELIEEAHTILEHADGHGLDRRARLELFASVCDAIQHVHQRGVIHRDLKPSNIIVDAEGHAKVIDFGVACATEQDLRVTLEQTSGTGPVGTPLYMSPEHFTDRLGIDTRSDVYSLGVVLYELLCGKLPYVLGTDSVIEAARVVEEVEPTRPSVVDRSLRGDLEVIVLKALAKDRARRYQSAHELAGDIRRVLAGEPITARAPTMAYRLAALATRHRWQTATAASIVLLILMAFGAVAVLTAQRAKAIEDQYGEVMRAAEGSLRAGQVGAARVLLDRYRDAHGGAWEWRHLDARVMESEGRSHDTLPLPRRSAGTAASGDGEWLAVSLEGTPAERIVQVWRVGAGAAPPSLAATLHVPPADVAPDLKAPRSAFPMQFDSSGRRLYATCEPGIFAVFDRGDGSWRDGLSAHMVRLQGWSGEFWRVAACPWDADVLGILGRGSDAPDGNDPWLVDATTGKAIARLTPQWSVAAQAIAFSPADAAPAVAKRAAVSEYGGEFITRVFDVSDMRHPRQTAVLRGHTYHVWDLAFSADGTALATCSMDESAIVWDVAASERDYAAHGDAAVGVQIDRIRGHGAGIVGVGFTDGQLPRLVTTGGDGSLRSWPIHRPRVEGSTEPIHEWTARPELIATTPGVPTTFTMPRDGAWVALMGEQGDVSLWRTNVPETDNTLHGIGRWSSHGSSIRMAEFSRDGALLASSSGVGDVALWDTRWTSPVSIMWDHIDSRAGDFIALAFHPSGKMLVECNSISALRLWDISSPRTPRETWSLACESPTHALACSPSELFSAGADGIIRRWRLEGIPESVPQPLPPFDDLAGRGISTLAVSPDGRWLAAGIGDPTVKSAAPGGPVALWELHAPESPARLLDGHTNHVRSVRFSPDGALLASADADGRVFLWSVESGVGVAFADEGPGGAESLAFHPDSAQSRLFTGAADGSITVWDVIDRRKVASLQAHVHRVTTLAVSPDGTTLASGSEGYMGTDNTVRLWETDVDDGLRAARHARTRKLEELAGWLSAGQPGEISLDELRAKLGPAELAIDVRDVGRALLRRVANDRGEFVSGERRSSDASVSLRGTFADAAMLIVELHDAAPRVAGDLARAEVLASMAVELDPGDADAQAVLAAVVTRRHADAGSP